MTGLKLSPPAANGVNGATQDPSLQIAFQTAGGAATVKGAHAVSVDSNFNLWRVGFDTVDGIRQPDRVDRASGV